MNGFPWKMWMNSSFGVKGNFLLPLKVNSIVKFVVVVSMKLESYFGVQMGNVQKYFIWSAFLAGLKRQVCQDTRFCKENVWIAINHWRLVSRSRWWLICKDVSNIAMASAYSIGNSILQWQILLQWHKHLCNGIFHSHKHTTVALVWHFHQHSFISPS